MAVIAWVFLFFAFIVGTFVVGYLLLGWAPDATPLEEPSPLGAVWLVLCAAAARLVVYEIPDMWRNRW